VTARRASRWRALAGFGILMALNLAIVAKLFTVEFLPYTTSIEGTFIAIPRIMAKYPGAWNWWPFWGAGMPFETTYLPFSHWLVAGFSLLTGTAAPHAFHIVMAAVYAAGAPALFWMAGTFSRRWTASFFAALVYSCVSLSALAVPAIAADAGGALNLRRLQALVYYGESPHTVALALLPLAAVCFARALGSPGMKWKIFAGASAAAVVLSNAFGVVILCAMVACWLLCFPARPWWLRPAIAAATGILTFAWISPWLSPTMLRAIRGSALVTGGDYRYTAATWFALAGLLGGFALLWLVLKRLRAEPYLRFFWLLAYLPTALVLLWYAAGIAVIPQPSRYQLQMDLVLPPALVFTADALLRRAGRRALTAAVALAGILLSVQAVHCVRYANHLVRAADPETLPEYRLALWMDRNRPGQRAFIGGFASLLYNAVTDSPQVHGFHEQHAVNPLLAIAAFTIYSGMNAGDRDAEYSLFWLKAFGARAVSVSGAYARPRKFDGLLPLLWREGDQAIYEVPARSTSLAHVIPAGAVARRTPRHGLDIEPARAYVAALDDPAPPPAAFRWTRMDAAEIHASPAPGQVIAVQVTYAPGWEAFSGGVRQPVRRDGLGLIVIDPACANPCAITLRYTGGPEGTITRAASLFALLVAAGLFFSRTISASRQISPF
jgi:hypothetical protein